MASKPAPAMTVFEALGLSLAPSPTLQDVTALRIWILSSGENLARLFEAAAARDLLPAVEYGLSRHALVPPASRAQGPGPTPAEYLRTVREDHEARRAAMRSHLVDAVRALNAPGIEPLLLKGCVSLWTGAAPWRQMRDLDILVRPGEADAAQRTLAAIGFRESPAAEGLRFGHHLPPLIREGMPGWLEVHFRASDRKAEIHLPTEALWSAAMPAVCEEARARILPPPEHVLHGLAHNHFGHRMSSFGTINLKGLHEFAWAVAAMSAGEGERLDALSRGDKRLRSAFEMWAAAAARFYSLALPPAWAIGTVARSQAEEALRRTVAGRHESLVATFLRTAGENVGETEPEGGAPSWLSRLRARLGAVRAAAREMVVPWRDRDSLRDKSAGIRR